MLSILESWRGPLPKYKYRIVEAAYTEPYESGKFFIQYKKWYFLKWETDGHWSIGPFPRFYRQMYDTLSAAEKMVLRFKASAKEPKKIDVIHAPR